MTSYDAAQWRARLAEQMESESRARAADPSSFLVEVLRHYWLDNTEDEADALWRVTVRDQPAYAIDVLNCLYVISQDPPGDLVDLVVRRSGVIFYRDNAHGPSVPYEREDYADWLQSVHDRWHAVFTDAIRGRQD